MMALGAFFVILPPCYAKPLLFFGGPFRMMTCQLLLAPELEKYITKEPLHAPISDLKAIAKAQIASSGHLNPSADFEPVFYKGASAKLGAKQAQRLYSRLIGIEEAIQSGPADSQIVAMQIRGKDLERFIAEAKKIETDLKRNFQERRRLQFPLLRGATVYSATAILAIATLNLLAYFTDYSFIAASLDAAVLAGAAWAHVQTNQTRYDWEQREVDSFLASTFPEDHVLISSSASLLFPETLWHQYYFRGVANSEGQQEEAVSIKENTGSFLDRFARRLSQDILSPIDSGGQRQVMVDRFAYKDNGEPVYLIIVRGIPQQARAPTDGPKRPPRDQERPDWRDLFAPSGQLQPAPIPVHRPGPRRR